MARQHRQSIRPDLIGEIAVRTDAIGADEHGVDFGLPHQGPRRRVGDQGTGDPSVAELPHGEPRALQQGSSLVDVDVDPAPLLVREIDRRQRGSDSAGRQRARIAMRQDIAAVGKDGKTVLADSPAHGAILLPDGGRFGVQPVPHGCGIAARPLRYVRHAMQRPPQVDRRGTRVGEQLGQLRDARAKVR